jgi:hypothetical protein
LTGNRVGTFDTRIFRKKLLAAHQNTHSYHIRTTFPSPYLPFKEALEDKIAKAFTEKKMKI